MATPKKKHLIELMIEAGVEWPDGAEYAAQDNRDLYVWFYSIKPKRTDYDSWAGGVPGVIIGGPHLLPSLCRNWHQTIVTREQYAEAVAAIGDKASQSKESEDVPDSQTAAQLYSGDAGVMPSESIESLLAEIKAKYEEHDELVVKVDALAIEITSIEQQVNNMLKEYGFSLYPVATSSEPEQPVITDWRDLCAGDVVLWAGDSNHNCGEYTVKGIESEDYAGCCSIHLACGEWIDIEAEEWRFIRRP